MRRRGRLQMIRLALVGSWLAAQLFGPVAAVALASGEHLIEAGDAAGILVLRHASGTGERHRHRALEALLASGSGPLHHPHDDHVVRLPQVHLVKHSDFPVGSSDGAGIVGSVSFASPGGCSRGAATYPRGRPRRLPRSMPLLL